MKTKTEQLDEISNLQKKALKIFKRGNLTRAEGAKVNKMLEEVIKLEDKYLKRNGRNPSKEYGDIIV